MSRETGRSVERNQVHVCPHPLQQFSERPRLIDGIIAAGDPNFGQDPVLAEYGLLGSSGSPSLKEPSEILPYTSSVLT